MQRMKKWSARFFDSRARYLWEVSVPNSLPWSFDHVRDVSHHLQSPLGQQLLLLLAQALVLVEGLGSVGDSESERKGLFVPDQDSLAIVLLMDLDSILMGLTLIVHGLGTLMLGGDVVVFDLRLHRVHFSVRLEEIVECNHIGGESLEPFLALVGVEGGGFTVEV